MADRQTRVEWFAEQLQHGVSFVLTVAPDGPNEDNPDGATLTILRTNGDVLTSKNKGVPMAFAAAIAHVDAVREARS
jgi:hypothetical protein